MKEIDDLLVSFLPVFLDFKYRDGTGKERLTLLDIWCNLCLVLNNARPSFLIQWIDYLDKNVFFCIMDYLTKIRDIASNINTSKRLLFLTIDQGVLVISYNSFYNAKFYSIYDNYISYEKDEDLGLLLGYPGVNEFILPSDQSYYDRGLTPPNRHHIQIGVNYGTKLQSDDSNLLAIVYRTEKTKQKIKNLYSLFSKILSSYNNDIHLTFLDSSVSSASEDFEDEDPDDGSEEFKSYYDYVLSNEPLETIWYDNYDLAFSDGFFYLANYNPIRQH